MRCRGLLASIWISTACLQAQTNPDWWSNVIRSGDSHALENNYAPANLGQLKNFAEKAEQHLNQSVSAGGSTLQIEYMIGSWNEPLEENYKPINLGQLKAVADKFYARLDEIGFNYKAQLISNGYNGPWTTIAGGYQRPWNESSPPDINYAPANLGQLKILFSFNVANFVVADSDNDGIPNSWETAHGLLPNNPDSALDPDGDGISNYQEYLQGSDPHDFWNGLRPNLTALAGNGTGDVPGSVVPLSVALTNAQGGAYANGTVNFVIASSIGGSLSSGTGLTDSSGMANVSLTLPATVGMVTVKASFSNAYGSSEALFSVTVNSAVPPPNSPTDGSVMLSTNQTQATITWTDNSTDESGFYVDRSEDNRTWTRVGSVAANITSFTDSALTPGRCYIYIVTAHY